MSELNKIYEMTLHEETSNGYISVLRVPGGWIYTRYQLYQRVEPNGQWSENYIPSSVFVPFDNEFQKA